ncbi:MAG TPA: di-heme-cytochrome C peroxidase [Thermoanaerobaculia bacterium]|nr:di-heme-cytochrome C peroxidase [Thermoanaerobaculia bacterium]
MRSIKIRVTLWLLAFLSIVAGCETTSNPPSPKSESEPAPVTWPSQPPQSPQPVEGFSANTVTLDQGWDSDRIQKFWFTGQGSEVLPRTWMLALQRPTGERFATAATFDQYRYLPASPTKFNPDGWPLGFANSKDPASGVEWFGYTCAGCHTGRVDYGGKSMILTGGATLANLSGFLGDLIDTMRATAVDDARLARFADQVLGPGSNATAREQLKAELLSIAGSMQVRKDGMVASDNARLDAFGTIFNEILATALDLPNNQRFADGPVSYPFIWDSSHTDRVQWNGAVSNAGVQGPIGRNVAEILGVFGRLTIDPSRKGGYSSSIDFKNLGDLELWLKGLWSPLWPEEILPPLDRAKVERGKAHYTAQCASCHEVINRTDPTRKIYATMGAIKDVGTDPQMATAFANRNGKTGRLEGKKEYYVLGRSLTAEEQGMSILNNVAAGAMVADMEESGEAALKDFEGFYRDAAKYDPIANPAYKARPLNGIWATPPYLHNGSVSSLWELLQPPEKRSRSFYVGSYNFDPVKVGYETGPSAVTTLFKAEGVGNSNAGHTYGTQLTDAEKWELLEFLKSL